MTKTKIIRLACSCCDRDDMDGITAQQLQKAIKAGWIRVSQEQTYHQAIMESPPAQSPLDWWTHLGTCPDCAEDDA